MIEPEAFVQYRKGIYHWSNGDTTTCWVYQTKARSTFWRWMIEHDGQRVSSLPYPRSKEQTFKQATFLLEALVGGQTWDDVWNSKEV